MTWKKIETKTGPVLEVGQSLYGDVVRFQLTVELAQRLSSLFQIRQVVSERCKQPCTEPYLLSVLPGPVDVVAPGNDDGKLPTDRSVSTQRSQRVEMLYPSPILFGVTMPFFF